MPISLYDAAIPTMMQLLEAGQNWLDKAEASSLEEPQIAGACLIDGMLPFAYQIKSMAAHSQGAVEGLRKGVFSPDMSESPTTLGALRATLVAAHSFLSELEASELDGMIGQDMMFALKDFKMPFVAENFLLSFSVPNFHFHATTAYAILRAKGVPVGKLDYLGTMRTISAT